MKAKPVLLDQEGVRGAVRKAYGSIATEGGSCCTSSKPCCGASQPDTLATAVGYSKWELASLPEGANMGLSCGNPTALASLKPGEVVLDLGSGGGLDVFIAAAKVGRRGRAIGVDMTPEMVSRARGGIRAFHRRTGLDNVEFRLGEIEHIPVADASVDVVISNCVINLSPDKPQVWREIARVLRPGGRVAVSDLALLRPLPRALRNSIAALTGCIAGAAPIRDVAEMVKAAGLVDIVLSPDSGFIEGFIDTADPHYKPILRHLPRGKGLGDYVTSLYVTARKKTRSSRNSR